MVPVTVESPMCRGSLPVSGFLWGPSPHLSFLTTAVVFWRPLSLFFASSSFRFDWGEDPPRAASAALPAPLTRASPAPSVLPLRPDEPPLVVVTRVLPSTHGARHRLSRCCIRLLAEQAVLRPQNPNLGACQVPSGFPVVVRLVPTCGVCCVQWSCWALMHLLRVVVPRVGAWDASAGAPRRF